jgi:hypothetical protein
MDYVKLLLLATALVLSVNCSEDEKKIIDDDDNDTVPDTIHDTVSLPKPEFVLYSTKTGGYFVDSLKNVTKILDWKNRYIGIDVYEQRLYASYTKVFVFDKFGVPLDTITRPENATYILNIVVLPGARCAYIDIEKDTVYIGNFSGELLKAIPLMDTVDDNLQSCQGEVVDEQLYIANGSSKKTILKIDLNTYERTVLKTYGDSEDEATEICNYDGKFYVISGHKKLAKLNLYGPDSVIVDLNPENSNLISLVVYDDYAYLTSMQEGLVYRVNLKTAQSEKWLEGYEGLRAIERWK